MSDTLLSRKTSPGSSPKVAQQTLAKPPKDFVPNTNKHATEGSNPVWMSNVAYDNMNFEMDEDDDLDNNFIERIQQENNLDSLDVNVLMNKSNTFTRYVWCSEI